MRSLPRLDPWAITQPPCVPLPVSEPHWLLGNQKCMLARWWTLFNIGRDDKSFNVEYVGMTQAVADSGWHARNLNEISPESRPLSNHSTTVRSFTCQWATLIAGETKMYVGNLICCILEGKISYVIEYFKMGQVVAVNGWHVKNLNEIPLETLPLSNHSITLVDLPLSEPHYKV